MQRYNLESAVLDFEELVEVGLGDSGHFEMHFGCLRGERESGPAGGMMVFEGFGVQRESLRVRKEDI